MPFGDSKGAFYEDEFHRGVEEWNSFTGDSGMVTTPNQMRQNQQLEDIETKPATGMGVEVADRISDAGNKSFKGGYLGVQPRSDNPDEDVWFKNDWQNTWDEAVGKHHYGNDPKGYVDKLGPDTEGIMFPDSELLWTRKKAKPTPAQNDLVSGLPVVRVADTKTASPLVTITDADIDKAMGIATAFSGGGLATKWPKGYYDKVPLEQRLSRSSTEPSHPGYRWDVLDKDTGKVVRKDVMTATGARRSVDNMDNKYGGYKHRAEPRQIDEGSYTQGELDFIKSNKIDFNSE